LNALFLILSTMHKYLRDLWEESRGGQFFGSFTERFTIFWNLF